VRIGVISDTHNYLDPRVAQLFGGVEHILHGGDIGNASIIRELERIAPVTAVLGNCDSGIPYPETEVVTLGQRKFLLHHIVDIRTLQETVRKRIEQEKPEAVIFGHTHKPFHQIVGKTLYLNPGYAGKQRFNLERSVAILHSTKAALRVEYLKL
jgi:putative phosphoesterase